MMEEIGRRGLSFFRNPKQNVVPPCARTTKVVVFSSSNHLSCLSHLFVSSFHSRFTPFNSPSHVGNHPPGPATAGTSGPIYPTVVRCPPHLLESRDRRRRYPRSHHWLERFSATRTYCIDGIQLFPHAHWIPKLIISSLTRYSSVAVSSP